MNIVIINKSDATGGAAVVSRRLMDALRLAGHDARMLVSEKLTDSPYVETISSPLRMKSTFLADRVPVAIANRFDRSTLFKIDTASAGLPLTAHPLVKKADAILINWINQGILSLKEIQRLADTGKKIIWTMHDMWPFTGICHHAGACRQYITPGECHNCALLPGSLAYKTLCRKKRLYSRSEITFAAVSSWLADCARRSTLLHDKKVVVIPNPFPLPQLSDIRRTSTPGRIRLIFVAARLDDDVKDFPTLKGALSRLAVREPELASKIDIKLIGSIKDRNLLEDFPVKMNYLGTIHNPADMKHEYENSDIVVSSSTYETLPGTLIEGQAFGAYPVAFDRGGQRDIIIPGVTGQLADWDPGPPTRADSLANAIIRACRDIADNPTLQQTLYDSVATRFSAQSVATAYSNLII